MLLNTGNIRNGKVPPSEKELVIESSEYKIPVTIH